MLTKRVAIKAALFSLLVSSTGCSFGIQDSSKGSLVKNFRMKRVALGRFLIGVPEQARLRAIGATYWGFDISQIAASKNSFSTFVKEKVISLNKVGQNGQKQLVKENAGASADSHIILYLEDPNRSRSLRLLGFKRDIATGKIQQISTPVSQDKKDISAEYASKLLSLIQPSTSIEAISAKGLALDTYYIAASDPTAGERVSAGFDFSDNISFGFTTHVREPSTEAGLIERTKKALGAPELANTSQVLRTNQRSVASFEGEEVIYKNLKGSPEAITHNFEWQYKGRNQIAAPAMKLSMELLGDPNSPASISDEDALNLWDTVLKSVQVRPGGI